MTLKERIDAAISRIASGMGAMRIPADPTDPDLVLAECRDIIDGEPARLAAAREAAIMEWRAGAADRDELRADCERRIAAAADELDEAQRGEREAWRQVDEVRTERDALRARVAELEAEVSRRDALIRSDGYDDMRAHAQELARRAEKAEAQVAEAHERLDEFGMRRDGESATLVEGIAAMRERIDEYRAEWYRAEAQVAAAREACAKAAEADYATVGEADVARDVLRAMDEASTTK